MRHYISNSPEIATLIERGSGFLKRGDLASARLLLRRAAEAGSANGALMLGSTFDPLIIQQLGVIGIVPDVASARQWYQKAAELGSDVASQRLADLKITEHNGLTFLQCWWPTVTAEVRDCLLLVYCFN